MYYFVPIAVETAETRGAENKDLFRELGVGLRDRSCDPRSESYLVQQI